MRGSSKFRNWFGPVTPEEIMSNYRKSGVDVGHNDFTEGEQLLTKGELEQALRTLKYTSDLHAERIMGCVWTRRALNDVQPPGKRPSTSFDSGDRVRIKGTPASDEKTGYVKRPGEFTSAVLFKEGVADMPNTMLEKVMPSREVQVGDIWQLPNGNEYVARLSLAYGSKVVLSSLDGSSADSYPPGKQDEFFNLLPTLMRRRGYVRVGRELHLAIYGS